MMIFPQKELTTFRNSLPRKNLGDDIAEMVAVFRSNPRFSGIVYRGGLKLCSFV